ncbi:MAG: hypothetical protein AAAFM81_14235 [Pseudomonadota bacterium]
MGGESTAPAKRAAIQKKITDSLRETLSASGNEQHQTRQAFRRRAEDLKTLQRMRLLPPYAVDAVNAFKEVEPTLDDRESTDEVLSLLINCYHDAAAT